MPLVASLAVVLASAPLATGEKPERPRLLGISHVAFRVSNLAAARAFYEDFLGFRAASAAVGKDGPGEPVLVPVNDRQYVEHARDGWPREAPKPSAGDNPVSRRILHAGILVGDLGGATRFYGDALGFTETWAPPPRRSAERSVAVTFDDLPAPRAGVVSNEVAALRENTRRLLAAFRAHRVPVVGFVNEGKLFLEGEKPRDVEARMALLEMWLEAGLELGNHTWSHRSLNTTPLEEFEGDVVRGEAVTRRLLAARGGKLRYFRHPFLQVGLDLDKRRAFEAFLAERGYTIAPVTIDDDDYVYAAVYADALRRRDQATASRLGADYLRYMEAVLAFAEEVSRNLTGREIRQVLLLHANALNADYFSRLAGTMERRGYRFVTLEEALGDEAYGLPDAYVGRGGVSWLHHWELTAGRKRSPSPDPPEWVTKAYEGLRH